MSSFLKMGLIIAFLSISGNSFFLKDILMILVIKGHMFVLVCFIIFEGMLSIPVAMSDFMLSIIFSIFSSVSSTKLKGSKSKLLYC